ncbi:MAG: PIN domain-containing protein [bacterium]|nr:PIN domain-containing protein [bacterium]
MSIILDTGPLVAFLNRRDAYHHWAVDQWSNATPPLLTCEAVVAEACYLVRTFSGGEAAVLELVARGVVEIPFVLADQAHDVARLLKKYCNVPMSLADGCLVRMAEQLASSAIMTLDSDFAIYRRNGREVIPLLTPDQFNREPPGPERFT